MNNIISYCNGSGNNKKGCNTTQAQPPQTKSAQLTTLVSTGKPLTFSVPFLDNYISKFLVAYAKLDSPALTGIPTAPIVYDVYDDSSQIATTAFVQTVAQHTYDTAMISPVFTGTITLAPDSLLSVQGRISLNSTASSSLYLNSETDDPLEIYPTKWLYLNQVTSDVQTQFSQQTAASDAIYANVVVNQQQLYSQYGNTVILQNNVVFLQGEVDALYGNIQVNQSGIANLYGNASVLQVQTTGQTYVSANRQTGFAGNLLVQQNAAVVGATTLTGNVTAVGNLVVGGALWGNQLPVTSTQIGYLTNVAADVQGQLNQLGANTTTQTYDPVSQTTQFSRHVSVLGNVAVSGATTLTGNVTATGNLVVGGALWGNQLPVTSTQIGYLTNVAADVQGQLNQLGANTTTQTYDPVSQTTQFSQHVSVLGNVAVSGATALTGNVTAAGNLVVSGALWGNQLPVTSTQIGYLTGLTSDAQTQLTTLANQTADQSYDVGTTTTSFGRHIEIGGEMHVGGNALLDRNVVVGGGWTVASTGQATLNATVNLNASIVANGQTVTSTQIGYLSGLTADVQTQMNATALATTRQTHSLATQTTTWTGVNVTVMADNSGGGFVVQRLPNYHTQYGDTNATTMGTGTRNCALGGYALYGLANGSGSYNVAVGSSSSSDIVDGVGGTMGLLTNGSYNTATGYGVLKLISGTASYNTGVGALAFRLAGSSSQYNTGIGYMAGTGTTTLTGTQNTFLGANSGYIGDGATATSSTAIGYGAMIDTSHQIVLGTSAEYVDVAGNLVVRNESRFKKVASVVSYPTYPYQPVGLNAGFYVNYTDIASSSRCWIDTTTPGLTGGISMYVDQLPLTANSSYDFRMVVNGACYVNTLYVRFAGSTGAYLPTTLYKNTFSIGSAVYVNQYMHIVVGTTAGTIGMCYTDITPLT